MKNRNHRCGDGKELLEQLLGGEQVIADLCSGRDLQLTKRSFLESDRKVDEWLTKFCITYDSIIQVSDGIELCIGEDGRM